MKFCVIGAGSGGRAFAAYLSSKGHSINLYNRSFYGINDIKKKGGILAEGDLEGFFPVDKVTQDLASAVKDVHVIMVVTPASAHNHLAIQLAPFLSEGQIVILNPGRTFGSVEFSKIIKEKRGNLPIFVCEAQTLLFTCRADEKNGVKILRIKKSVDLVSFPEKYIDLIYEIIKDVFPQFESVENYLEVTLNNIGMLVHPAISLLNAGIMDIGKPLKFYSEGASPRVCQVLELIEFEINKIFDKLGFKQYHFYKWANKVYGIKAESVYDAIQQIESYKTINAPDKLVTRYFTEDVPTGLVPISSLAKYLKVETPTIDSIIHLTSILCGQEFKNEGRTLERLELHEYINEKLEEVEHITKEHPERWKETSKNEEYIY